MASIRSTTGVVIAVLLLMAIDVPAAQASARGSAPAIQHTGVAASSAAGITPRSGMPCVHRGITFFCGQVPAYGGTAPVVTTLQFSYGNAGDLPLFGDWNGDGDRTPAVFRPGTSTWYLSNTDNAGDTPHQMTYGMPGDIPLAGDWTGSGIQTIGVYRPSTATFYLRYTNTSGVADITIPLGNFGDIPLAGDFDHTGTTTVGIYRPRNATFYFTHSAGPVTATPYGNPGDRPFAGSYWCNSCTCTPIEAVFGVFRPADLTWNGLCVQSGMSAFYSWFRYGDPSDLPLLK